MGKCSFVRCVVSVAEQTPQVAHVEEVSTSVEGTAAVAEDKLVNEKSTRHNADNDGSSTMSTDAQLSHQDSAVSVDSSFNNDSTAACSEPTSSAETIETVSSSAPSSGDDKPPDDTDDNSELTLLVETYFLDFPISLSV